MKLCDNMEHPSTSEKELSITSQVELWAEAEAKIAAAAI
jgi:hypothetical protein